MQKIKEIFAPMGDIGIFNEVDPHREYVYLQKRKQGLELMAKHQSQQPVDPMTNLCKRFDKYAKRIFQSAKVVALEHSEFAFAYVLYMNAWFRRECVAIERLTSALYQFEVLSFITAMKNSKISSGDQRLKEIFSAYVSKEKYAWGVVSDGSSASDIISSLDSDGDSQFMSMFMSIPIDVEAGVSRTRSLADELRGDDINFKETMNHISIMKRANSFDFGMKADLSRLEMYTGIPEKWRLEYPEEIKALMLKTVKIKAMYEEFALYVNKHPEFHTAMVNIADILDRNVAKIMTIVRTCRKRNLEIIMDIVTMANETSKASLAGMSAQESNAERVRLVNEGMKKIRRDIVRSAKTLCEVFNPKPSRDQQLIVPASTEKRMTLMDIPDNDEATVRLKESYLYEQKKKGQTKASARQEPRTGPVYSYWDDSKHDPEQSESESSDNNNEQTQYALNMPVETRAEHHEIDFFQNTAHIQKADLEVARQSIGIIMDYASEHSHLSTQASLSSAHASPDEVEDEKEEGEQDDGKRKEKKAKRKLVNIGASSASAMLVSGSRKLDVQRQSKKTRTSSGLIESMMCEKIYRDSKSMVLMATSAARDCKITIDMVWMCIIFENLSVMYETETEKLIMPVGSKFDNVSSSMYSNTAKTTLENMWAQTPIRLDGVWDRLKMFSDLVSNAINKIKGKNGYFDTLVHAVTSTPNIKFSTRKIMQTEIMATVTCPITNIKHQPGYLVSKTDTGFVQISVHMDGEQPFISMLCALPVAAFLQYMRTIANARVYIINILQAEYVNYIIDCNKKAKIAALSKKKGPAEMLEPSMTGMIGAYMDPKNEQLYLVITKLIENLNKMAEFCFDFVECVRSNA